MGLLLVAVVVWIARVESWLERTRRTALVDAASTPPRWTVLMGPAWATAARGDPPPTRPE